MSMKKLISIKSLTCEEGNLAKFLLGEFQKLGVDEAFIDAAGNVVAIIRGEGKGPNIMCDVRMLLNRLESQHRHDAATLTERMAAQTLRRINTLLLEAYREALVLDETFQD